MRKGARFRKLARAWFPTALNDYKEVALQLRAWIDDVRNLHGANRAWTGVVLGGERLGHGDAARVAT